MDAILEAAFQILEARGPSQLKTNRVAERAGVSVGTWSQYFADKAAILAAIGHRQAEALREQITAILLASPGIGSVRAIVRVVLYGVEGSAETRTVLSNALFQRRGEAALSEQHLALLEALAGREELDALLGKESAFVLTHAVIGLVRAAVAEPELQLDPVALEDEQVLLMESYLAALAGRPRRDPKGGRDDVS